MSAVTTSEQHNSKFERMVKISHKLYTSDRFKDKENFNKRKKLISQLRNLFDKTNRKGSFTEAVVKYGWPNFEEWSQTTQCDLKLESESHQKRLLKMLNNQNGICCSLMQGPNLEKNVLKGLVSLTSKLMKEYYDNSPNLGPWNDDKMASELMHKNSHCIIVRNSANNEVIGYVSFRMELQVIDVATEYLEMYIYECMIDSKYQRKGYGKYLMSVCDYIADKSLCDYIELTVFTANIAALKFYRNDLNFSYDKNELAQYKGDYRILTKCFD